MAVTAVAEEFNLGGLQSSGFGNRRRLPQLIVNLGNQRGGDWSFTNHRVARALRAPALTATPANPSAARSSPAAVWQALNTSNSTGWPRYWLGRIRASSSFRVNLLSNVRTKVLRTSRSNWPCEAMWTIEYCSSVNLRLSFARVKPSFNRVSLGYIGSILRNSPATKVKAAKPCTGFESPFSSKRAFPRLMGCGSTSESPGATATAKS